MARRRRGRCVLALGVLLGMSRRGLAAQSRPAPDLRQWIPRMKVERAHGGDLATLASEHRVVVAMTTIPPRIDRIEPVLDGMLAQSWPVAAIYLNVPYRYNRTGEPYRIPGWLENKPGVTIVRCEDMGPGTHLLNTLRLEPDPWTWIAVVDDDHIYSPLLVENLMRAALAYPGSAVAAQGFLSIPGLEIRRRETPRYLHDQGFAAGPVLVSYLGVVYQRGFFDEGVFDYRGMAPQCRYQDDMWFSAHLAGKGIKRLVLGAALGVQELRDMHLGPESLTFWEENKPRRVSEECNDSLLRRQPQLWAFRRRLVFAVVGVPPPPTEAPVARPSGVRCAGSAASDDGGWGQLFGLLRQLSRPPDLTYLCTGGDEGAAARPASGDTSCLGGLLVAHSEECRADDGGGELRVGRLLRGPLQWEGDPGTVVVLGNLQDFVDGDLEEVANCAAEKFDPHADPAHARAAPGEASTPFCRAGGLVAVSVGAFARAAGS